MWRALFLTLGGMMCVIGVESLVLDHAVLAADAGFVLKSKEPKATYDEFGFQIEAPPAADAPKIVRPPEWAPWSMISTGAVIALYAFAYKGGGE